MLESGDFWIRKLKEILVHEGNKQKRHTEAMRHYECRRVMTLLISAPQDSNISEKAMKVIDSGMPEETYWNSLFDIPGIVEWLEIDNVIGPIVEIGCGYGTFTVPVAKKTNDRVYAFDIDSGMLDTARSNIERAKLTNVQFFVRDVLEEGTGLEPNSAGMVLLFNILHFSERRLMLKEAARILKPSGMAAIIHWRRDIPTPRGPRMEVRPSQETILDCAEGLDLYFHGNSRTLEPYHWGIQLTKGIPR